MEKNLFICETPFQILASLLIIFDKHSDDVNNFIITDNMRMAKNITLNLNNSQYVNFAYFAKTRHEKGMARLSYFIDEIIPFNRRWNIQEDDFSYDRLFLRNFTASIAASCFDYCSKKNPEMKVYIIDEGYSNYTGDFWNSENRLSNGHKVIVEILSKLGKKRVYENINKALFFCPQLFHKKITFEIAPMIRDDFCLSSTQITEINRIFHYTNPVINCNKTFIFFEECFNTDFGKDDDLEMLHLIENIVGKNNIIVKLHPRSEKDRFTELGYQTLNNAQYPWEVFAINNISNNHVVLISYSSGALLNYLFFTNSKIQSIFLYKLFPESFEHMKNKDVAVWFDEFCRIHEDNISIPKSITELEEALT